MKIHGEQMEAFQRSADRAFVGDLCWHLRLHHSRTVAPFSNEVLRAEVARGIERARAHGLRARPRVAFFVALLFEIGPGFDEHPRVREIMARPRGTPDERLAELRSAVSEEEWEEARRIRRYGHSPVEAKET